MTQSKPTLAVESIAFQGTALFNGITECVGELRHALRYAPQDETVRAAAFKLIELVRKSVGMRLDLFIPGDSRYDFSMASPVLTQSHIFDRVEGDYLAGDEHAKPLAQATMGAQYKVARGTVDMRRNKISGFFSELKATLILPGPYLRAPLLNDDEVAALILHEMGHNFTSFEYINRTLVTNQVLADIAEAHASGNAGKISTVIALAAKEQDFSDSQKKMLAQAKRPEDYVVYAYAIADQKCRSELGFSVYETTSCEQLADQYMARCGAGRAFITASDKLFRASGLLKENSKALSIAQDLFKCLVASTLVGLPAAFFVPAIGIAAAVLMTGITALYEANEMQQRLLTTRYDDFHVRLERVYHQMVQQLKDPQLDNELRKTLLGELEETTKVLEPIREHQMLDKQHNAGHYVALFFSSIYRKQFNSEMLQRELEALANNNLFVHAAKFKVL